MSISFHSLSLIWQWGKMTKWAAAVVVASKEGNSVWNVEQFTSGTKSEKERKIWSRTLLVAEDKRRKCPWCEVDWVQCFITIKWRKVLPLVDHLVRRTLFSFCASFSLFSLFLSLSFSYSKCDTVSLHPHLESKIKADQRVAVRPIDCHLPTTGDPMQFADGR